MIRLGCFFVDGAKAGVDDSCDKIYVAQGD